MNYRALLLVLLCSGISNAADTLPRKIPLIKMHNTKDTVTLKNSCPFPIQVTMLSTISQEISMPATNKSVRITKFDDAQRYSIGPRKMKNITYVNRWYQMSFDKKEVIGIMLIDTVIKRHMIVHRDMSGKSNKEATHKPGAFLNIPGDLNITIIERDIED